ncbi:MAG: PEP-CTERM sorting domain-containing protein, partial [Planctomycetota bacterium]
VGGSGAGSFGNTRVFLDYNLAADADVQAAGGFVVEYQVNPGNGDDANGESGTGREFAGIILTDTNDLALIGGAGAVNGGNASSRFGLTPRNSGSVGYRQFTSGGLVNNLGGNPNAGGFNEQIVDQVTFDAYTAGAPLSGGGETGLLDPFISDIFYDVRLEVTGDFSAGSEVLINAFVDGVAIDFDLSTAEVDASVIAWGDNAIIDSSGGPPVNTGVIVPQLYLAFAGFNNPHLVDNLVVSAIPEPGTLALAALGGLVVLGRRRQASDR